LILVTQNNVFGQKKAELAFENSELIHRGELFYTDSVQLRQQLQNVQLEAYKKGYVACSFDSIVPKDSLNTLIFGSIGPKFKTIALTIDEPTKKLLRKLGVAPKSIEEIRTDPAILGTTLQSVLNSLVNNGYPFAKVGLEHLSLEGNQLHASLTIQPNMRLAWKSIELIGKNLKISSKFIASYLHISPGDWYDESVVQLIPTRLKQLTYLKQTKPAALLYTPEGVIVYVYLEGKAVSSFNGTVGLQQNPVSLNYQFTGDLRLKLQNSFKHGELFELNWRSIAPGSPQLKTQLTYPFLLNTPFGIDAQFQLVKRDSSFLELKSGLGIAYYLSSGNTLKGFYRNYNSSTFGANSSTFGTVKNNSYGLSISHQTIDYVPNPHNGIIWVIETSAGQRKLTKDTFSTKALVFNSRFQLDWYFPLFKKWIIRTGVNAETYSTKDIQQNELIRFGGNLNQRGFMEDELLATSKATGTVELRFILDQNSFLFAFYDQSWYERNTSNYLSDAPRGFGTGISFGTSVGIFNLSYALGQQLNNPVLLRDSKIHFGYIAYF
jgi:hypothetical protein